MRIVGISLLLVLLNAGCFRKGPAKYKGNVSYVEDVQPVKKKGEGSMAPEFSWYDSTGKRQSFRENIKGKVVMINFWATWCPFCKAVLPSLRAIEKSYDRSKVLVMGINTLIHTDESYQVDHLYRFAKDRGFDYQLLMDNNKNELWSVFGMDAGGVPVTVMIDRNGTIVKAMEGARSEEQYREEIDRLLQCCW